MSETTLFLIERFHGEAQARAAVQEIIEAVDENDVQLDDANEVTFN